MSIKGFNINGDVQRYDYNALDNKPIIPSKGSGLTEEIKQALLQLASKVPYIDENGQTYYDELYNALYATPQKSLDSISATFVQTSTIYTIDSVSSIPTKGTLTVTAFYDDMSSEIIQSGYTLSGNLTVGTSLITVSYQNKTATFAVNVTAVVGTFSVSNNLSNCATDNSATVVSEGDPYSAHITADFGYTLIGANISIMMGGSSVTGYYQNGTISIPNVTGDIEISVSAVAKTLSSLEATFNQGSAAIYDTDALSDLNKYLVVTATYTDETTETIGSTDYTLSGTLTAGDSTITVSYGGMTDTFTVTVTHNDDEEWDYVWRYQDGLPPASDWKWSTSGGQGQVHTIVEDGMLLTSKTGTKAIYTMLYAPTNIDEAHGCIAEFAFYIPDYSAMYNTVSAKIFDFSASNGTNGIQVAFNHPKNTGGSLIINLDDGTGTQIGTFQYETPYVIRMEIDLLSLKGKVFINGDLASSISDITTITATDVHLRTNGVGSISAGGGAVVQSVRIKYENPDIS